MGVIVLNWIQFEYGDYKKIKRRERFILLDFLKRGYL